MGEEFAEVIRGGFDAFAKGDMDHLRNNVFTADTVWHVGGQSQLSGTYRPPSGARPSNSAVPSAALDAEPRVETNLTAGR